MASHSTMWDWKMEPESPSFLDSDPSEDVWLFDDHDVKLSILDDPEDEDEKLGQLTTKGELASKLLDDLDEFIKKEPFNDWLEEKIIDLPIFEELPPLNQKAKYKSIDTETLIQEFENVYGEYEFGNGALTPPQSPPLVPTYPPETSAVYHHLEPQQQNHSGVLLLDVAPVPAKLNYTVTDHGDLILIQTLSVPVVEETAALDELVRARAADIDTSPDPWEVGNNLNDESDSVLSPPESGSDNSNSGTDDSEWSPVYAGAKTVSVQPKRKRSKPYARPVEEKKLRKKEQNKNAATRYRQKKKAEVDVILGEEKGLQDKNSELKQKVTDISLEIKYLKGLMRDLFKAKGLLK